MSNSSATPWTVAQQVSPSIGFPRQEYWNVLPFPFPWDLPNPGIEFSSPALQIDSLPSEPPVKPMEKEVHDDLKDKMRALTLPSSLPNYTSKERFYPLRNHRNATIKYPKDAYDMLLSIQL